MGNLRVGDILVKFSHCDFQMQESDCAIDRIHSLFFFFNVLGTFV
jgi:hypothetical protein